MARKPKMSLRTMTSAGGTIAGAALLMLVGSLCPSAPAHADWLVTRDGARIETRGAWKVDGRRVIFTLPNGTLSTIRADELDLDQSALATTEAKAPPVDKTPQEPVKREPVLRLTEKDIPPSNIIDDPDSEEGGAAEAKSAEPTSSLEVISWEKTESSSGDGVEIFGTIRNNSTNMIVAPTLLAAVYDADGGLLATNSGNVNSPQIAAGKTANFRVVFTGFVDFAAVRFDAQGRGYKQQRDRLEDAGDTDAEEETPIETEIQSPLASE